MGATIEISSEQRARLAELAARRGEKDFSKLIQEAVEAYLARDSEPEPRVQEALAVLGTLDEEAAERLQEWVRDLRSSWR